MVGYCPPFVVLHQYGCQCLKAGLFFDNHLIENTPFCVHFHKVVAFA